MTVTEPEASQDVLRLQLQARLYDPLTRRLLLDAGIGPGQRVLDLGTGAGDVALLAADLVGPAGSVLSIDLNPQRVAYARDRCSRAGVSQVSFVEGDLDSLGLDEAFDAVVSRFVLRDVQDAPAVLATAARLAPAGVVVAQEKVLELGVHTIPAVEVVDQAVGWMTRTRQLVGVDTRTGARLPAMFQAAGLPAPALRYEAPALRGEPPAGCSEPPALRGQAPAQPGMAGAAAYLTETLRGMLGLTVALGIATPEEIGIETLAERMRTALGDGALLILTPCVGAWSRLPG
jgi:ubiquinone/menaquinone biosynthesis C-methylase UbiE